MSYEWNFAVVQRYLPALLWGAGWTLQLSVIGFLGGLLLSLPVGFARASGRGPVSFLAGVYTEVLRTIPALVLMIWLYYCLPILFGVRLSAVWSATLALFLSSSAYSAEILRAGIRAVPTGQIEAAYALGYSRLQAARDIVAPQALKLMVPPFLGLFIATVKNSALASFLAAPELLHTANNAIAESFRPLELYTVVAVIYVVLLLPLSLLSKRFEWESQYG
jgi:polar amino acid transport system permease protein